jgi:hypothetical protein
MRARQNTAKGKMRAPFAHFNVLYCTGDCRSVSMRCRTLPRRIFSGGSFSCVRMRSRPRIFAGGAGNRRADSFAAGFGFRGVFYFKGNSRAWKRRPGAVRFFSGSIV